MFTQIVFLALFGCAIAANHPDCGTKGPNGTLFIRGRIIGGTNAKRGEWPWQGSLRLKQAFVGEQHICGCALLNEEWVMTAAHCVQNKQPSALTTVFGAHDFKAKSDEADTLQPMKVSKVIMHPKFNTPKFANDVALLKLASKVDLKKAGVGTICIPDKEPLTKVDSLSPCVSTGWGRISSSSQKMPTILQKVPVKITPLDACRKAYSNIKINITDGMICVGEMNKGVCNGDSGGPLNCKVGNKWFSYGATSFGKTGCHKDNTPSVYARASEYASWIWGKIDEDGKSF